MARSVRRVEVTTDGRNLVSHHGHRVVVRTGQSHRVDTRVVRGDGRLRHLVEHPRPGRRATHLAVAIADGADCLKDIDALRKQSELFGDVHVDLDRVEGGEGHDLARARRDQRGRGEDTGGRVGRGTAGRRHAIDFDATLVTAFSEKQDAAPTYKHGYGFHPLGAWCDTTVKPLGAMLRPGNAGSNDADDHLELLDQVIAALPPEYQVGHQPGDDPSLVRHHILVRADSGRGEPRLKWPCGSQHRVYSIGHPVDAGVREALLYFQKGLGRSARGGAGPTGTVHGWPAHRSHGLVGLG